jgi:UDP-GlcNAc:undecaprenyl-phosphate GlcNAc-1-phosphate transferase
MNTETAAVAGCATAAAGALLATPIAIAIAHRTNFYDHPRGYRKHSAPTPLLGGAAVLAGFLIGALVVGAMSGTLLVLLGCAVGMWALGTVDDRAAVAPKWRLLAEAAAAVALVAAGLGWKTSGGDALDYVLTLGWIVAIVNGFNLMDNLDGACGTVGCVSALGIGTLAAIDGQATLAGLAFALAGACAVFLRWNLAAPAKVFLGDGGSMLVGFLVAALAMAIGPGMRVGGGSLLAAAMFAGLPILDTTLVSVSRKRRRVPLVTGGRDHLSHRLLARLGSPRVVAITLALVQGVLCAVAIVGVRLGIVAIAAFAASAIVLGVIAIAVLDSLGWRPAGIAIGDLGGDLPRSAGARSVGVDSG